jgi:septum site-determining protein MinC
MASPERDPQKAFTLKGTSTPLTVLCLRSSDLERIERQLATTVGQTPSFFQHAPLVLDLEGAAGVELQGLVALLRRHKLAPVALRNPPKALREQAISLGLALLLPGNGRAGKPREAKVETPSPPVVTSATFGVTVTQPVRSGQVVYAPQGDLVVLAPVSSGAEVVADGNVHVYAPLRGRALAGVHDRTEARIFCSSLEAEFLSIAGHYLMADEIPEAMRGKAVLVCVEEDRLVVRRLGPL